jgi:AcrR family transcriptional regulator
MKKLTSRQLQAIKTQKEIYEAAIQVLGEVGFDHMTIDRIARKAGVSVGAFYHYYKSKNDILEEVFTRGDEYFRQYVKENIQGQNGIEKVLSYFDHFAKFYMLNGIDVIQALYKAHNALLADNSRLIVVMLKEIVADGIAKKEICSLLSADDLTDYLLSAARGIVFHWCMNEGKYELDEKMNQFFQFWSYSLQPR